MRAQPLYLKCTNKVDLQKPLRDFVLKKYGPEAQKTTEATFKDLESIRNSLDFSKMNIQLRNDYRLAAEFEGLTVNYLKYVYLMDNFFNKDFSAPGGPNTPFFWTDSFDPSKKTAANSHIRYELVSVLYNLGALFYTEGIYFTSIPKDEERLKGIAKLRNAIWCFTEIKQLMPTIMSNLQGVPSDMNFTFISLLGAYTIGMTYSSMIELLLKDPVKKREQIIGVSKTAAMQLNMALDMLNAIKDNPIPPKEAKLMRANLKFNIAMNKAEAYTKICEPHLQKVDEEVTKGHMGYVVSYLRIAKNDIDNLLKSKEEFELLTPEQKEILMNKSKAINDQYEKCALRNQKVYQQKEYKPEELPELPSDKTEITGVQPNALKEKIGVEQKFECFLSPEILKIKKEFNDGAVRMMMELENQLKMFTDVKNKQYAEAFVNYLLNLEAQAGNKQMELPSDMKKKLDRYRKNGGVQVYEMTRKNILESASNAQMIINQIKQVLADEKAKDEGDRQANPSKWTRPHSEQVNAEYVFKLKELEQKFFIAQKTDSEIFKKYDQTESFMQIFSQDDNAIISMIPKSTDTNFLNANRDRIQEVVKLDGQLNSSVDPDKIRLYMKGSYEKFMQGDFISSFININNKSAKIEEEFPKLYGPLRKELDGVNKQIQDAFPLIDVIASKAKDINKNRNDSGQGAVKIMEEMTLNLNIINGIFDDFQQGTNFYMNLIFHLSNLQKVVDDFCMAREIERTTMIEDLRAHKAYQNINVQNNNQDKFFQEKNMQFQSGTSMFVAYPQGPLIANNQGVTTQNVQIQKQPGPNPQTNMFANFGGPTTTTQMYVPPNQGTVINNIPNTQNKNLVTTNYIPQNTNFGVPNTNYTQQNTNFGQNTNFAPTTTQQNVNQHLGNQNQNQNIGTGYMPLGDANGKMAVWGNLVESTIIPNPFDKK